MIITVASGKGGTGKTTVAVSLALSLLEDNPSPASKLLYLDCDVEEPNAALFLKPVFEQREEVGILIPEVDFDKCTYCGRCAEVCQYHAIAVVPRRCSSFLNCATAAGVAPSTARREPSTRC